MPHVVEGRVWKFGDNINTDLIFPNTAFRLPESEQYKLTFSSNRPGWVDQVRPGDLLVGGENSAQPLSDDRIVDLLKGEGIEIARRTVAKYREAMRIPSSAERRRLGRLGMSRSLPTSSLPAAIAAQALSGPAD